MSKPHRANIISSTNELEEVTIHVQDFGIGVPKSAQDKLFNRFFQAVNLEENETELGTFPGLGLGLYLSAEIIKCHNGKIWLESAMGKGSTFYFTLPTSVPPLRESEK